MIKRIFITTCLAFSLVPLRAQEQQKWVALQGGYDWQANHSRHAEDNGIVGLATGLWCTPRWGGELSVLNTRLQSRSTDDHTNETHGFASALYNLDPGSSAWTPYLRAGLGVTRLGSPFVPDAATKLNIHAGLGIQSFSTEHVVFGVEARAVRIETQTAYTEIMGLATLGFRWGGSARIMPVAAPAPVPVPPILPTPNPAPVTAPNAVAPEAVAPVAKTVPPMVAAPVAKVVPPPPVVKFVLNDAVLHFANGRHILPPQGVKAVQIVAQRLKDYHGGYTLTVTGYTSSIGKPAFNRRLSQLRAEAVAKVLQQTGISAASMQTAGAGPDRPVASNHTRMGQAKNRRVEIAVQAAGATVEKRTVDTDVTE